MEELKKVLGVYNKCFFLAALLIAGGSLIQIQITAIKYTLIILGAIIAFYGVNYKEKHWICPHCKESLGKKSEIPEKCPKCHKVIK